MKILLRALTTAAIAVTMAAAPQGRAPKALDIYFIDVEGGQSTLLVTPAGETMLIDAGFPGDGAFGSLPGDPGKARDAQRILAAARDADIARIDFLLATHFHADHDGGVPEVAQLLPIATFIDHDNVLPQAESVRGTLAAFDRYAAVRAKGRHLVAKAGDRLPLKGLEVRVVSSAGATIAKPLSGAGKPNPACGAEMKAEEPNENPRSTGIRLQFGKFRFLDVGDLSGRALFDLVCPRDLVGPVGVYLVTHHGGNDAGDPATFAAFTPRAAILNNGPTKGGAAATLAVLHRVAAADDVWQLHRSQATGADNFPDAQIANLDTSTAHWIKVHAYEDGSFELKNGRTGIGKHYRALRSP